MLIHWIAQAVAMMATALLLPGLRISSFFGAVLIIVALAFVNANLWDASLFFQLPSSFTLHALYVIAANGILFWVLVKVLPGIHIEGLGSALLAPIIFSVFTMIITPIVRDVDWKGLSKQAVDAVEEVRDDLKAEQNVDRL